MIQLVPWNNHALELADRVSSVSAHLYAADQSAQRLGDTIYLTGHKFSCTDKRRFVAAPSSLGLLMC